MAVAAGMVLVVYLALFSRVAIHNFLFMIVLFLPVVLNIVGWRRWKSVRKDGSTARWRKMAGLLGLVTGTLALVLAVTAFGVFAFTLVRFVRTVDHLPLSWLNAIDFGLVARVWCSLSVAALFGGIVAPARIRLVVALSGLTIACMIVSVW